MGVVADFGHGGGNGKGTSEVWVAAVMLELVRGGEEDAALDGDGLKGSSYLIPDHGISAE